MTAGKFCQSHCRPSDKSEGRQWLWYQAKAFRNYYD